MWTNLEFGSQGPFGTYGPQSFRKCVASVCSIICLQDLGLCLLGAELKVASRGQQPPTERPAVPVLAKSMAVGKEGGY